MIVFGAVAFGAHAGDHFAGSLPVADDAATGTVSVVVINGAGSASSSVTLGEYAPSFNLFNSRYAAAEVQTPTGYDLIGPTGGFSFATRPVKAGEILELYGVGFGPTTPEVPAGEVFPGPPAPAVTLPKVTIGGLPATVNFAGIVEAGLFQLNVVVPNAGSGDQLLEASVGGATTPSGVYITLQ